MLNRFLHIYLRVISQLRPELPLILVLLGANLVLAAAQFAEPVLFGRVIDKLVAPADPAHPLQWIDLVPLLSAWAFAGLFCILASVLVALHADRLSHRRRLVVMAAFFEHVLHLPLSFHTASHSGRLLKIMLEGASGMAGLWLSFLRENCASLIALLVLLPASLFINWRLAGLLMILVVIFGVMTAFVIRRTEVLQRAVEHHHSELAERASDALGNIPVIQSFTRIEGETRAMRIITDNVLAAQLPVLSWWALATVATKASATITLLLIFVFGTWLHFQGQSSVGEIVTFMNFAGMLIGRLEQVIGFVNNVTLLTPKLSDFFDVLDLTPGVAEKPDALDPARLTGVVSFEKVIYSYDGKRPAVWELDFNVAPGQTIALVGATGSGKSTTLGLLHRVFDPDKGRVTIDGIDIRDMTLAGLRRNIGVVFQEPMLFARSIEENLKIGKPDATIVEIELAIERAQAKEFIGRQSDGLATIIRERGRSLSGGERQRLSIARALLKDPPILIFDEATSALDATTERALQEALEAATMGRTTFIIAHRLATIRKADMILVFDQGRIVERGNFDALMEAQGRFAALAKAQLIGRQQQETA